MSLVLLTSWIENISKYPVLEIFNSNTKQNKKAEDRLAIICEELYKFNYGNKPNVLSELRSAYRDLDVALKFGLKNIHNKEYIQKVVDTMTESAKMTTQALDSMHKKDQLLNQYYQSWRVPFQDLKNEISNVMFEYNKHQDYRDGVVKRTALLMYK